MPQFYLSVDLGGTSLRLALLNDAAEILVLRSFSSDLVRRPEDLVVFLRQEIGALFDAEKIDPASVVGAALGIPGLIDVVEGKVVQSPHFPLWENLEILPPLQKHFPFPLFMDNDANQAALGEAYFGAGKQHRNFLLLTLGTGIGGALIGDRQIFHGDHGFAGEFGHITLDRQGLPGALGIRGTFETFCSQSGLRIQVEHWQNCLRENSDFESLGEKLNLEIPPLFREKYLAGKIPTKTHIHDFMNLKNDCDLPEKLWDFAKSGNALAQWMWEDFGKVLACGIASLVHAFGVFHIIVGGGLAAAWDEFMPACRDEIPRRTYSQLSNRIQIIPAALGHEAGLKGAVARIQIRP